MALLVVGVALAIHLLRQEPAGPGPDSTSVCELATQHPQAGRELLPEGATTLVLCSTWGNTNRVERKGQLVVQDATELVERLRALPHKPHEQRICPSFDEVQGMGGIALVAEYPNGHRVKISGGFCGEPTNGQVDAPGADDLLREAMREQWTKAATDRPSEKAVVLPITARVLDAHRVELGYCDELAAPVVTEHEWGIDVHGWTDATGQQTCTAGPTVIETTIDMTARGGLWVVDASTGLGIDRRR